MQFWSGTAFMTTSDALAVTRMLDETGFDGMICADHLIYPRTLTSPYPSGAGWMREEFERWGNRSAIAESGSTR
jgi:hypothetical protein